MASPNTKTFGQLVSAYAAAVQASAAGLVDFSIGSILRAVGEATGQVGLWIQGLILHLFKIARASTSTGADLDSFYADFHFGRLGSAAATGSLTYSRLTTSGAASVLVGAVASTSDGTESYAVTADPAHARWNGSNGYTLPIGLASVTVPAVALTNGSAGNAAPGAIAVITSSMPGIDSVTNAAAFTAGANAETDAQFRARFPDYLDSLTSGTIAAMRYAVASLQVGAYATALEAQLYNGTAFAGNIVLIVDDGTGAPSAGFLASALAAAEAEKPAGSTVQVYAPVITTADVTFTIDVDDELFDAAAMETAAEAAVTAYIGTLKLGEGLNWSRLWQVAYDASPGITDVIALTLNGTINNIPASAKVRILAGTVTATAI